MTTSTSFSILPFDNSFIQLMQTFLKTHFSSCFSNEIKNSREGIPLNRLHEILPFLSQEDQDYHSQIQTLGVNDRQSIFVKKFHSFVDSDPQFQKTYSQFILEFLRPLFPQETSIVVQKTPNLRISFPGQTAIGSRPEEPNNKVIGLHKDSDFGHHPQEINFIIPLTDMFNTNTIFVEPRVNSNTPLETYQPLTLTVNQCAQVQFSQLYHYNQRNTTQVTRISLDLRVIPFSVFNEDTHVKPNYFHVYSV